MAGMTWAEQSGYLTNNKLNRDFQKQAQPLQRFRQFVDVKEAFGKQHGQTVNWLKVANVGTLGGVILETNTMNETTQSLSWGTLTVNEYGDSIPLTFKLETLSEFDVKEIIRAGLLDDAVKVMDGEIERQFNSTTTRYVGLTTTSGSVTTNGTATTTNTSVLNSYHTRKMRLELEKRNVPTFDGDYVMIASLEAAEGLEGAMESIYQYTELGIDKVFSGEIGRVHGVRVVKDGWATRFVYNSTLRTATAPTWTTGNSFPAYVFGARTVREAFAVPEEIRLKVVTDYGRSKGIAWYFLGGWKIEWSDDTNSRIVKWDSAG